MGGNLRVVHFINQFFAGIGGEAAAGSKPGVQAGPVGPGKLLAAQLNGVAEVVATIVAGDSYVADHPEAAAATIAELLRPLAPDLVVAGPAFQGGRYGVACGLVCRVAAELGVPAVSGMDADNPGLPDTVRHGYVVPSGATAAAMGSAMGAIGRLAVKLLQGAPLADAATEGYFPRGIRRNQVVAATGAERAVDLLLKKLRGVPYASEVPLPSVDLVLPPPLTRPLREATVALVTEGGIVPRGNPDGLKSARADRWFPYSIAGLDDLTGAAFESIHSGYDSSIAKADPDRVAPVDVLRQLEAWGEIGRLLDVFYSTTGNVTTVGHSVRMAREIAADLKERGVDAVVLTAT